ncbi:ATP-dependent Clp protease proteolytic subunit protein [Candidatus Micropelagos thuwalensis]|uniref:DEAD-box ATP-dependent RNA helicase RhpA n=1 Tax=Candidatus Micropelagius thuwalensis TaxID=1397666 RepID=U2WUP9_9PROT|nr:DEAD/DEAH box helicase [Candidatus Micropelagos thuwalensis]ERL47250.1 ATP-dependent Clp protease proteolytic subunit protein [Candidatus Micropelagos thuwalensis]
MKFDELGLAPEIMNAINDAGYTTPTPIQAEAIPHVIAGRDVLGIAQTGTGKTASFTLPMIHRLMKGRAKARMPRSLILEPTRELAAQVADNFDIYGKNTKLTKALLIGGVSFADQEKAIMRGADVLIATPGRLLDHVERGGVLLRGVEVLVIDEADRMLDMGFIPDIERIVKLLPFTRQTLFFSATMPPEITRLTQQFLSAPARVEVAPPSSTNENVSQLLISVSKSQKLKTLKKLFDEEDITNGIIFCNRKRDIGDLLNALQKNGYPVVSLHGDMDQHMRLKMLDRFKGGEATYLIASDVAARGLDIPAVSHVFNYDVPTHAEDYVHRIGRTGRAGRKGAAITLFTKEDSKYIDAIEKLINRKIDVTKTNITPEDVTSDKEEKAASKPRRKNDDKGDKKGREKGERKGLAAFSKNKKEKKQASNAPRSTNKPVQKETRANKAPVGFGENIPAFLKNAPE